MRTNTNQSTACIIHLSQEQRTKATALECGRNTSLKKTTIKIHRSSVKPRNNWDSARARVKVTARHKVVIEVNLENYSFRKKIPHIISAIMEEMK